MQKSQKSKAAKIQQLLTTYLLSCGSIELQLPDGVKLEIGITKDGKHGKEISTDYCFVKATREDSTTLLDTFNVSLEYAEKDRTIICIDSMVDDEGKSIRRLEIV